MYDDAALTRLLDRNRPIEAAEGIMASNASANDDYLSVFRSAYFVNTGQEQAPEILDPVIEEARAEEETVADADEPDVSAGTVKQGSCAHRHLPEAASLTHCSFPVQMDPTQAVNYLETVLRSRSERFKAREARRASLPASRVPLNAGNSADAPRLVIVDSGDENADSDDQGSLNRNNDDNGSVSQDVELIEVTTGARPQ